MKSEMKDDIQTYLFRILSQRFGLPTAIFYISRPDRHTGPSTGLRVGIKSQRVGSCLKVTKQQYLETQVVD